MKHLMSGNEATARGVYEAGIKVCSAYPGTPSTEILENLPQYGKDVDCARAPHERLDNHAACGLRHETEKTGLTGNGENIFEFHKLLIILVYSV